MVALYWIKVSLRHFFAPQLSLACAVTTQIFPFFFQDASYQIKKERKGLQENCVRCYD